MTVYEPQQVQFLRPPVVEVALSLQSLPVPGVTTAHFGLFWNAYLRDDYPFVQEQPPIMSPPEINEDGSFSPQIFFGAPNFSRHWYLSPDNTRLVQLQQDRLVVNWRRLHTDVYPRYDVLRAEFVRIQNAWTQFLRDSGFEIYQTTRIEVTYINHLARASVDGRSSVLDILDGTVRPHWPTKMGNPRDLQLTQTFALGELAKGGSLTVTAGPAVDWTSQPVVGLNLVFQASGTNELEACMDLMDRGHNQIVNSFAQITAADLRDEWGEVV
ncbi:TIGR04255 family protein [uncultured Jatrophihabitans sp.]|uniref:TIGR04255 family protein n=1 Tax=uncultured Jatrophihabitans sp. TaxID=1610747 RepID=UPI0035CA8D9C